MKVKVFLLACFAILSGCASQPELTYEQRVQQRLAFFEKHQTRVYYDKPYQDVLTAAQRVLMLMDGDKVSFTYSNDGFVAKQKTGFFAWSTPDYPAYLWKVKLRELSPRAIVVTVEESSVNKMPSQNMIFVAGVGVVDVGSGTTQIVEKENLGTSIYALFFRRMDYILGNRKDWSSCKSFKNEMRENQELAGDVKPLCGPLVKDEWPEELRARGIVE